MPRVGGETFYLGIDPGNSNGGFAILSSEKEVLEFAPMPDSELDLWLLMKCYANRYPILRAVIEQVHSMPSQSAQSGFSFGGNYKSLRMALLALGIPFRDPTPQAWMKSLGIPYAKKGEKPAQKKEKLRAKAQQMFPSLELWTRPKSVGLQKQVCDAMLLAYYGVITNV